MEKTSATISNAVFINNFSSIRLLNSLGNIFINSIFVNNTNVVDFWNSSPSSFNQLTIDYSNTDHCGICNDYLLDKLKNNSDNKIGINKESKVLIDTSKDFVALGVQGGDVVYNNTANTQAQVVLVNGSVLILDVDIFGTPTTFDDAYTIFLAGGKGSPTVMQSAECCLLYVGSNTANASMEDATQYVDVRVLTCGDNEVIFKNFKVGEYLPIQIKQLFSTGTSVSARSSCLAIW